MRCDSVIVAPQHELRQTERRRAQGAPDAGEDRLALFVAGDDEDAKQRVSALIEEIGFAPIDTGSLTEGGRRQQTGSPVFTRLIVARDAERALAADG